MKKQLSLSLICIVLFTIQVYSQNKTSNLRVYAGVNDSEFLMKKPLPKGMGATDNENSFEFGVKYIKPIFGNFGIETGINYFSSKVKIIPSRPMSNPKYVDLTMISIPIYANYALGKYLFANAGPILDFQLPEESFDSQTGIGYSIGVGAHYNFKSFSIYINPNFKQHSLISSIKKEYRQRLTEFGIQFGIGYSF